MPHDQTVQITVQGGGAVHGDLVVPDAARGVVVFAHGSGSSRSSPRNRLVAKRLHEEALATLLMDLLTADEESVDLHTREHRFDIPLLAQRLLDAVTWLSQQPHLASLPTGYFGASTGAAAALVAAARQPGTVGAVVSRGGRPDLAGDDLAAVRAPTLLIVGGRDDVVIDLNQRASEQMTAERSLKIVPGATHLFEEPGALESVSALAADWFSTHLS